MEGPVYGERGEDFARIRLHGGWEGAFKNALELREIDEEVATGSDATPSDATPSDATPNDAVEDDEVKWKLVNVGEAKDTDFTVDVTMGNEMSDDEFREAADAAGLTAPNGAADRDPVWLTEEGNFDSRLDLEDGEPYELNENKLGKTTDFYAGWFFKSRVTSTQLEDGSVSAAAPDGVEIEVGDLEEEKPFEEISEALETEGLELADMSDTLQLDISLMEESAPLKQGDAVGVRIVLPYEFAERVTDTKNVAVIHFAKNGPEVIKNAYDRENGTVEFSMDSFSPVVLAITGEMALVTLENVPGGWSRIYETIEGKDGVQIQKYLPIGETVEVPVGTKLKLEASLIAPAAEDFFEIKNGDSEESYQDGDEYTVPSGEITITPVFQAEDAGDAEKRMPDTEQILAAEGEPALYREQEGIMVEFYLSGGHPAGAPDEQYIHQLDAVYVQKDDKFGNALEKLNIIPEMFGYDFVGWYVVDMKVEDDEPVSEINNGWPAVDARFERDGKVYNPAIRKLGEAEKPDGGDEGGDSDNPSTPNRPSGGRGGSRGSSSGSAYSGSNLYGEWQQDASGWRFRQTDGTYAANRWGKVNGTWYYFGADSHMVTGWFFDGTNWYYLNPVSDGTRGAMKTGWIYDDSYGRWFYLSASGEMMTGWQLINGAYYYLNPISDGSRGAMASEQWVGDYYVGADGARVIGAAR